MHSVYFKIPKSNSLLQVNTMIRTNVLLHVNRSVILSLLKCFLKVFSQKTFPVRKNAVQTHFLLYVKESISHNDVLWEWSRLFDIYSILNGQTIIDREFCILKPSFFLLV